MSEDNNFIDAETSFASDNDKLNFQFIILTHLKKITQLCCVEWHGGYWQEKFRNMGGGSGATEKYYVQDSRKCFWNSINCLYDMCFPYFDEQAINETDSILEELNGFENEWEELVNSSVSECDRDENNLKLNDIKIKIRSKKMQSMRKMFRSLSSFLKRVDYFKAQVIED